jgi:hypothetical protein
MQDSPHVWPTWPSCFLVHSPSHSSRCVIASSFHAIQCLSPATCFHYQQGNHWSSPTSIALVLTFSLTSFPHVLRHHIFRIPTSLWFTTNNGTTLNTCVPIPKWLHPWTCIIHTCILTATVVDVANRYLAIFLFLISCSAAHDIGLKHLYIGTLIETSGRFRL